MLTGFLVNGSISNCLVEVQDAGQSAMDCILWLHAIEHCYGCMLCLHAKPACYGTVLWFAWYGCMLW